MDGPLWPWYFFHICIPMYIQMKAFRGALGRPSRVQEGLPPQNAYIPREPQCLFLRLNWGPPLQRLSRKRVCPPLGTKGEGDTLAWRWGGGGSQFRWLEKNLSTLCLPPKIIVQKYEQYVVFVIAIFDGVAVQCTQRILIPLSHIYALVFLPPRSFLEPVG